MSPLPLKVPRIAESRFTAWVLNRWYGPHPIAFLKPFASLFEWSVQRRRKAYSSGRKQVKRLPVPVIVVGNIVVGGAGKTPTVLAVVDALKHLGYRPAILSRGYGAHPQHPRMVTAHSTPSEVGDEPVLLFRHAGVPLAVGVDRFAAGQLLLRQHPEINCIVSDDGLQHYALHRDIEWVVIARDRGLGNGALLPAGPLRESISRLSEVDALVLHGTSPQRSSESQIAQVQPLEALIPEAVPQFTLVLTMGAPEPFQQWRAKLDSQHLEQVANQSSQEKRDEWDNPHAWSVWKGNLVHAVAGIGHPQRFFTALEQQGMVVTPHAFADHHRFAGHELNFPEPYPIMMTEKDAVKCLNLALDRHWVVPLHAKLDSHAVAWLRNKLEK